MRFRDVTAVRRLVDNNIPESSSLEYKSQLTLATKDQKLELLKDLTGMANGGGGTVVYGVTEHPKTSSAQSLTPLPAPSITGVIEDIVRAGIHPPLLMSSMVFETDGGWIVAIDVEPSPLGPYMVEAYGEQRYHRRSGTRVHPMSEQEVRDAYALAQRSSGLRSQVWMEHSLPLAPRAMLPG
ncbi:MAG: AlbA family DNA-binding domain-containing protein [Acidimicrobiales bacterium]